MEKITLTIDLEAEQIDTEKFVTLLDIAATNLKNGVKAIKEGNIDKEGIKQIGRIIEEGKWWMRVKEDENFTLETD